MLREELIGAFAKRTAPGEGLTSLLSTLGIYQVIRQFDRYLATLPWPPRAVSHLTAEQFDGFFEFRKTTTSGAAGDLGALKLLLLQAEGVSDALAGRLASQLPGRVTMETKESYSRAEFQRITAAARADLRAAARRIRGNRELLARARRGEADANQDAVRVRLLEFVDRHGTIPREARPNGATKGKLFPAAWVRRVAPVREIVSWLHLTLDEAGAGAVLLAAMTGENPQVIFKVPAVHHRADGYTGATGTAILDLVKPRRGGRAHMTLALSEVPDWISVPEQPEDLSARDELHTAFGLYVLLHELTARSRALVGGNRLLVGHATSGGRGTGHGLRAMENTETIKRKGEAWGLVEDKPDKNGRPVPLALRLDLLRLTHIELYQRPVAHTEKTAATAYLARNRGNVEEYRKVVAKTLANEVDKARSRGKVASLSAEQVARASTDPEQVAAELGLKPEILKRLIAGELDTVLAGCSDNRNGPHAPEGEACPASFMLCLGCECARALPRHLPVQVLVHDRLGERREHIDAPRWAKRFAGPHAQLGDLLDQHDETAVLDARRDATEADHALVERFLNRELDLR
ncbi:hypothetical protein OG590_33050 [Streptomyces goshikiensis]|uniref:hypothetical protein n=1 Tax=Streptomyces TaxID=1883 RepID=UPI00324AA307|nr:hypothetical protein OG590_33050 [Streptomyces goshikiensis]